MTGHVVSLWGDVMSTPPRRCNVGGFNVLISTVPQRGRREKSIGERKKLKGDLMNSKRQADY
jgi:hypothetical protein